MLQAGSEIDYKLKVRGIPMKWRSAIDVWEPGRRFVDRQVTGPYLWWHHTHTFEELAGGTLIRDEVEYQLRGGWAAEQLAGPLVALDLKKIFSYRVEAVRRRFEVR